MRCAIPSRRHHNPHVSIVFLESVRPKLIPGVVGLTTANHIQNSESPFRVSRRSGYLVHISNAAHRLPANLILVAMHVYREYLARESLTCLSHIQHHFDADSESSWSWYPDCHPSRGQWSFRGGARRGRIQRPLEPIHRAPRQIKVAMVRSYLSALPPAASALCSSAFRPLGDVCRFRCWNTREPYLGWTSGSLEVRRLAGFQVDCSSLRKELTRFRRGGGGTRSVSVW